MFGVKARYKYARFRPLTGINCNPEIEVNIYNEKFPSPRGDKLQYQSKRNKVITAGFPSPCGDKLQSSCTWTQSLPHSGFRPLTGINCNSLVKCSRKQTAIVSVPLRGVVLLYHTLSQKKRTIHRRSADGAEKISHKDHLDSAEGASKP